MSDINGTLREAYELIRANDLSRARDILTAYMVDHPNDADVWWLYAYAVEDPEDARKALQNVLSLDPAYPGARDLMDDLVSATQPVTPIASAEGIRRLDSSQSEISSAHRTQTTSTVPSGDLGGRIREQDNQAASGGSSRRWILALVALLAIAALFLVFVLPALRGPSPTPIADATQAAVNPTADLSTPFVVPTETPVGAEGSTVEPVVTDAVEPTAELPTAEVTADVPTDEPVVTDEPIATDASSATDVPTEETPLVFDPSGVYTALATFNVIGGSAIVEPTTLGQTLAAGVCRDANQSLRDYSQAVVEALALYAPEAPVEVQAIGAKVVNCDSGAVLRYFGVTREDAEAFASGALTADQLRQRLQRLDSE